MKKTHLMLLLSLFVLLLAACSDEGASTEPAYPPEVLAEGEGFYNQTCFACHGPDATGIENLGKDLTTSEFFAESSDQELVAYVKEGRAIDDPLNTTGIEMPPKGGFDFLTDDNIHSIIAYLRGLQK